MIRAGALCLLLATPAAALDLRLPSSARVTVERNTSPDRFAAPVGIFAEGQVARINIDGAVRRAAWRLDSAGLTPLQVMRPLRQQLTDSGFEIVLDCAARECGGFDFRFATETLPGPNMYVNIRAFHVVTALRRGADKTPVQAISILASTAATSAYVQIIQAGPEGDAPVVTEPTADDVIPATLPDASALGARLIAQGHVVLEALDFGTGTSDLGPGPYAPLAELAAMLNADRSLRVALVGHTDAVGALAGNIALSRRRAQSVRQRLIDAYAVDPSRLEAEGMGYLSPVASNLTDAGREQNRRVEVVVLSAD
tara:strand:+ start:52351 stop:53286 length:936 start_codon:yes stop_codon:yes gene_type:complete